MPVPPNAKLLALIPGPALLTEAGLANFLERVLGRPVNDDERQQIKARIAEIRERLAEENRE